jgi:broad specificity phosphatase PhoE
MLIARHGQSDWNATRRWQGHADRPLTERGRALVEVHEVGLDAALGEYVVLGVTTNVAERCFRRNPSSFFRM